MTKHLPLRIVAVLPILALSTQLQGAEKLGDKAPPLHIANWVKGKPVQVQGDESKGIHVVEFWATWCGPCRVSIPHLSKMQQQFKDKDVVFIGISDEDVDTVKPFVERMGDKMDYTVAVDDNRQTYAAYMQAFHENGIPHAFVVNKDGIIAWHGHPMAGLDKVIEKMVAGKYDIEAAKRADAAQQEIQTYFEGVTAADLGANTKDLGKQILSGLQDDPEMLNEFSWMILTHPRVKHRDLDLAFRAAKLAYDQSKGESPSITDTYARALFDTGKVEEAIRYQKEAIAHVEDNPEAKAELEKTLKRYQAKAGAAPK